MSEAEIREEDLTPEQRAELEALVQEWDHHLLRVGVDMEAAGPRLRELVPPEEHQISDAETEVTLALDVSGIVETLRGLPDGAGTERFVDAYNRRPLSDEARRTP